MTNIARIRRSKGLNQTELAEKVGLTQPTVSRAENGDDSVTLGVFKSIAEGLDVRLSDLFLDDRSVAEQEVIQAYRRLSPDRQKGWQDMLRVAFADQG